MAVASRRRNSSQHCRCVRKKRKGAAQGKESQDVDTAERAPPRHGSAGEPTHCRILRKAREKTDSSSRSKILLPESWNQVERTPPRRDGTERFPIQTGDRSDLSLEYGFGACTEALSKAKLNIIRYLFNSATIPKLAAAVHYWFGGRVSNDEMSREASEGEGACLSLFTNRSHLPLREKLGWMTPRAGVKTTPAIETRPLGPPIPSGGPSFFLPRCRIP